MTEPVVVVVRSSGDGGHRLAGSWPGVPAGNSFLAHLESRAFAAASVRAYAYDLANFARFLTERGVPLAAVVPSDLFDWVDWQCVRRPVNRRVAAVRAFFEYLVLSGVRDDNPVPAPRRGSGLRPKARGLLGHLGPGRPRHGGRLVRQQRRLPESLDPAEVSAFLADLVTHRDRAIVLLMVLGGLRTAEVRSLRLADVDQGRRRVRIVGKGGRERIVPVDGAFFAELGAYLRTERPLLTG